MARRFIANLIGSASLAIAGSALAAPPPALDRLVEQLNDDSFEVRTDASDALTNSITGITLAQIESVLQRPDLTPEQRVRLLDAGERLFRREPRAALGVSWGDLNGPPNSRGVTVGGCIAGFDAANVLKPGDIIIAIGNSKIEDNGYDRSDLACEIVSHDPGEELPITLVRGGQRMTVTCKTGRYDELPRNQFRGDRRSSPDESTLDAAWKRRVDRTLSSVNAVRAIRPPLLQAGWVQAGTEMIRTDRELSATYERIARASGLDPATMDVSAVVPTLVAAGQPRGNPAMASSDPDPLQAQPGVEFRGPGFNRQGRRVDMRRVADVQMEINRNLVQLQEDMLMLQQPNLGAAQRRAAEERQTLARNRLIELQRQLQQAAVGNRVDE
jgi:hypothetical protein